MSTEVNIKECRRGEVVLIAGGGRVMTDIAARFVGSERSMDNIITSPYSKKIVENILKSGHLAATEFDNYIFGISGFSRVTEVQLVRKRLASYMIKSGRSNKNGKRGYNVVMPHDIFGIAGSMKVSTGNIVVTNPETHEVAKLSEVHPEWEATVTMDTIDILNILADWYDNGVENDVPEEDLRYMKPQATEFKAIVMMNAHGLMDWFKIRCCKNAQHEIRDLAMKMRAIVKHVSPDIFANAGASCQVLGYCPENGRQNPACVGKIPTHEDVLEMIKNRK